MCVLYANTLTLPHSWGCARRPGGPRWRAEAVWDAGGSGSVCPFHHQCSRSRGESQEVTDIPKRQGERAKDQPRSQGSGVLDYMLVWINERTVDSHITHFSPLRGRAVGPHSQPLAFPVTVAVPIPPWDLGICLWRGRWRRVQCLGAKQCSRAMEFTKVTESHQCVHLKDRNIVSFRCFIDR